MTANHNVIKAISENIQKVIIGKNEVIELILIAIICDGHILIEDVPGVGKTGLVSAFAKSTNAVFKRVQFTPDLLPSDITGYSIFNQKTGEFEFRPGAVMSNVLLADEINRTSPKTQSSLLEAMEEYQVTVDGVTYNIDRPFIVMATQNPVEYVGTQPLPEAQLDRFFMKISIGYPSFSAESDMLEKYKLNNPIDSLEAVASLKDILEIQGKVKEIYVHPDINKYIVKIIDSTRNHPRIQLGASPRGSLNLYRGAQACAFLDKRDYVLPDDVKRMIPHVLSHRLTLSQESKQKHLTAQDILNEILTKIRPPVIT